MNRLTHCYYEKQPATVAVPACALAQQTLLCLIIGVHALV